MVVEVKLARFSDRPRASNSWETCVWADDGVGLCALGAAPTFVVGIVGPCPAPLGGGVEATAEPQGAVERRASPKSPGEASEGYFRSVHTSVPLKREGSGGVQAEGLGGAEEERERFG